MIDYKFQDGDYFVWNKLSDWQKEYLLDNLRFVGSRCKTKESLDLGFTDAILYKQKWLFGNKIGFGTSTKYDGCCTNELYFNDVYYCTPNPSEEDERGFDGLIYVAPKVDTEYAVIDCKNLSSEQIEFITEILKPHDFDDIDITISDCRYLNYDVDGQEWFLYDKSTIDTEIHFNNIFVYKD